ncbi:MAG: hypothetical protein Q7T60_17160 [Sphingopyxis sp.]|nr:hypothetical protein [Sphingopyxis sp.]
MVPSLVSLLVLILVGGLVVWLLFYLIDMLPMPAPFNQIAKAVVILIAILVLLERTGLLGSRVLSAVIGS